MCLSILSHNVAHAFLVRASVIHFQDVLARRGLSFLTTTFAQTVWYAAFLAHFRLSSAASCAPCSFRSAKATPLKPASANAIAVSLPMPAAACELQKGRRVQYMRKTGNCLMSGMLTPVTRANPLFNNILEAMLEQCVGGGDECLYRSSSEHVREKSIPLHLSRALRMQIRYIVWYSSRLGSDAAQTEEYAVGDNCKHQQTA